METIQQTLNEQAQTLIARYLAAVLALRQQAGEPEVHDYRIVARRLLALLALWRPLVHHPELERRLGEAVHRLSTLRDAQVYGERYGALSPGTAPTPHIRVPMLTVRLEAWFEAVSRMPPWIDLAILHQQHLALRLVAGLARFEEVTDALNGEDGRAFSDEKRLRHWHKLRLELKQTRYGVELLLAQGAGESDWLRILTAWQARLGQLQDWRQWRKLLKQPADQGKRPAARAARAERKRLKRKIGRCLLALEDQQAELVGLKLAMLSRPRLG